MHSDYGVAIGYAKGATHMYQDRYPNRVDPDRLTSMNIHLRLSESGSFKHNTSEEKPRSIRSPKVDEVVLMEIEENPKTSKQCRALNIYFKMV